jgi:2-methylisocitrate lyase-like PEP mutase family enzyme
MNLPTIAEKRRLFRKRLGQPGIVVAPGCYDAFSAKIADHIGFEALYMTGAGVSATLAGAPDVGLLTMTEMVEQALRITDVVALPLISDADTGYGGPLNVIRTIRQFERAGVCAIHIEDQQIPKKCGHLEGKRVVSTAEMVDRLKAAVDARTDPNFLIIARTDARAVLGMNEALDRARRYADAGADILFVEAPEGLAEVQRVGEELTGLRPLLLNRGGAEKTPPLSAAEAEQMGFKIIIFPGDAQKAAGQAMLGIYQGMKESGNTRYLAVPMMSFQDRFEILGMSEMRRLETRFSTDQD